MIVDGVIKFKDPVTGEWLALEGIKGEKGDIGSVVTIDDLQDDGTLVGTLTIDGTEHEIRVPNVADIVNKMNKTNPKGTGSLSMNRASNTTTGNKSTTLGDACEASGNASFAEGVETIARGQGSHASGVSYLEAGNEQYVTAGGVGSSAEGYATYALSDYQKASGKFNEGDTNNIYAEIVGGGTPSQRKNIRTVDWHGNEVIAGNFTAGGEVTDGHGNVLSQVIDGGVQAEIVWEGEAPLRGGWIVNFVDENNVDHFPFEDGDYILFEYATGETSRLIRYSLTNDVNNNGFGLWEFARYFYERLIYYHERYGGGGHGFYQEDCQYLTAYGGSTWSTSLSGSPINIVRIYRFRPIQSGN